jgi:hypothetical protein
MKIAVVGASAIDALFQKPATGDVMELKFVTTSMHIDPTSPEVVNQLVDSAIHKPQKPSGRANPDTKEKIRMYYGWKKHYTQDDKGTIRRKNPRKSQGLRGKRKRKLQQISKQK